MGDAFRPELVDFLDSVQRLGNDYWSGHTPKTLSEFREGWVGGSTWDHDTRWLGGFSDDEISQLETRHGVRFPQDYRAFLGILGGTDRPALRYAYEGSELDFRGKQYIFPDWTDHAVLSQSDEVVLDSILFDVENDVWFDGWGARPDMPAKRRSRVTDLMRRALRLIPVHGHRFMIAGLDLSPAPILSGIQTDFILYASSVEHLMVRDFPELCGDIALADDTEVLNAQYQVLKDLPFWGDFMM